jgi:Na+/H+-dicarboxylate symporter
LTPINADATLPAYVGEIETPDQGQPVVTDIYVPAAPSIRRLRNRANAWVRGRLWLQVVIGLAAGIATGFLLGPELGLVSREAAETATSWMALPGKLFLALIAMVLAPLVAASIIHGLSSTADPAKLRSVGARLALYVVVTTTAAAALGIALALYVQPGELIDLSEPAATANVPAAASPPEARGTDTMRELSRQVPDLLVGLVPQNVMRSILDGDMLAIVIFAILVGIACVTAQRKRIEPFLRLLDAILEVSMTVVKWAMFLAPWAVFGLMAQLVAKVGAGTVLGMGAYVLTVLAGLLLLFVGYLVIVGVLGNMAPPRFVRSIASVQLLAFSTSSSAAVMPLSIETAVRKLDVPEETANLVVPLGATVNMAGTALYQSVAVVFLAQMSGIDVSLGQLVVVVLTLVASSIGAPGAPGVSIVILSNIVSGFGIPTAGLVLILGVDRILDMARTVVNVTGDLAACVVLKPRRQSPAEPV